MRIPRPPHANFEIGLRDIDPPTDVQMIVHGAWLLAGIAIAVAGCSVADESQLHQAQPEPNTSVAHLQPQANATSGNVDDMTY
ncbi:MAG: hypothetical protein ACM3SO_00170 [Betaproteobacteria bacterium]